MLSKERIKSIILVLLIVNCLQLAGQIWFNKKLWPTGYNFFALNFSYLNNVFSKLPFDRFSTTINSTVKPQQIVINGGNAREVYYPGQKQYVDTYKTVSDACIAFLKHEDLRGNVISIDEWKSMLKGKSIYLNYGYSMDFEVFASSFTESSSVFSNTGAVSAVAISGDNVTNETIICLYDKTSATVTKHLIGGNGERLLKYIESVTFGKSHNKSFSFELFWDLEQENAPVKRNILIDSFVLLPMESENTNIITAENPLENEGIVFDRIVNALGYTPSSLRKSISVENITSYVENRATIKIDPIGIIEYNAVDAQNGIPFQNGKDGIYNIITKVLEIAERVYHEVGIVNMPELFVSSDLITQKSGNLEITMNYSFNAKPIILYHNNSQKPFDAISAQVEDGYLKSFKMFLRTFDIGEEKITLIPAIRAIDLLAKHFDKKTQVVVEDVFKCYCVNQDDTTIAWGIKTDDVQDGLIIIDANN